MLTDIVVRQEAQSVVATGFSNKEKDFETIVTEPLQLHAWRTSLSSHRMDSQTNWQLYVPDHDCHWSVVELPMSADVSLLPALLREAVQAKEKEAIFWRKTDFTYNNLALYSVCAMVRPPFWSTFKHLSGRKYLLPELLLRLPDEEGDGFGSLQTETGDVFLALDAGKVLFAAPYRDQESIADARQRLQAAGFTSSGDRYWLSGKGDVQPLPIAESYGFDFGDVRFCISKRQKAAIGTLVLATCFTVALNFHAHQLENKVSEQAVNAPRVARVESMAEPSLACGALAVFAEKKLPPDVKILDWFAKDNELLLRGRAQSASTLIDYCRQIEKSGLVGDTRLHSCRQTDEALAFELVLHPKEGN